MEEGRCEATVYRRDTYRRTGRGSSGFSLHYERGRCMKAAKDEGLCAQHKKLADKGHYIERRK